MPLPRPVILLAEDDVIVRNLVRLLLEHDGYQLLVGADGAEALALARSYVGVIDLLLTDIEMPRMNGLELSQQIIAERPGIRVLVMSGQTSDSFRKLNFKFPFLNKPFVVESFRQKVREALADPPGGQQVNVKCPRIPKTPVHRGHHTRPEPISKFSNGWRSATALSQTRPGLRIARNCTACLFRTAPVTAIDRAIGSVQ